MGEQPGTKFDLEALGRAFESGDPEEVLAFYSDDHEHVEIDSGAPPSSPRTRTGAEAVQFMRNALGSLTAGGTKVRLENLVPGDVRAACTIALNFPDGRRLLSNTIFDLEGGRVVRQLDIQVTDPRPG